MDIYKGLHVTDDIEIDDAYTECTARVLNGYILEDGLGVDDPEDIVLERLMKVATRWLLRFQNVVYSQTNNPEFLPKFQRDRLTDFEAHASSFNSLYVGIMHMAEAPYYMTNWSIAFLIDSALKEHGIENAAQFNRLSDEERKDLDYSIRFCENLIQEFHLVFMSYKR